MARTPAATVVHAAWTVDNDRALGALPCPLCCIAALSARAGNTNVANKLGRGFNAFRIRASHAAIRCRYQGFAGGPMPRIKNRL
jgi:hypothetical protein